MVGFAPGPQGGDMSDDQQVTLGEVYRLCVSIENKVKEQNGRVTKLENALERVKAFGFIGVIIAGLLIDWLKRKVGL
jgi:hypothetical protein